jgi:SAM-dependent methyltransferase
MNIADQVRKIYELRPYPFGNAQALKRRTWSLGLEWIDAIGRVGARGTPPARILVAGCGDGTEAFNLQRRLPGAEIVAVDFSSRSIALAKRLQRRARRMRSIRFVEGDLSDPRLPLKLDGEFDLILCHGVFSYIPRDGQAMKNFARCLRPDGVLYLSVNGSNHVNVRLRRALPEFGLDVNVLHDSARVRQVLRLCDSVTVPDGAPRVAAHSAGYLASDVFGVLNRSLPLSRWVSVAQAAGLHYRGNLAAMRWFRRLAEDGFHSVLLPRSRAQVSQLLELLCPSQFHRLLLSKTPEANPPWENRRRLLAWRLIPTRLFRIPLPKPSGKVRDRLRQLTIASRMLRLSMEWQMPEWELELLRCGDGRRSLGSILDRIPLAVPFPELRLQLFFLYQLGIVNILPPEAV